MLPEGWTTAPLGDCAKFVSGGTPSKEREDYWSGDFPWVTAKDMKTFWLTDTGLGLTSAGKAVATVVPSDVVLVLTRGMTLLKDLPVGVTKRELSFNQDIKALLPSEGIDAEFLAFQLIGRKGEILDLVDTAGHGTGRLDTDQLKQFPFRVPPYKEQKAIAKVLGAWDTAITTNERLLANSRRQKSALVSELLMSASPGGRGRSEGSAYPASVQPGIPRLPPTPQGWRKATLGQHLKEVLRPVALVSNEAYTLVTVRRSRGGVDGRGTLLGAEIKTPTQFHVKVGDFLISKRQIVHGACGIVPSHLDGALVSNEYAVLNADEGLDTQFLAYLAETTYFQQTCFQSSIGVHVEKMLFKLDRWLTWPFNIPPLDVQRRIVAHLDLASQQIRYVEGQLERLKAEKRALMADLLTGKRRVRLPAQADAPEVA